MLRTLLNPPPAARYVIGGWSELVASLEARLRRLGVTVETGARVERLPDVPAIVATELPDAARLLGDETLTWSSGRTVCLDVALTHRRGDPFVVCDLDEAGWLERYTSPDPSLAPDGEELIQAQMPIRPAESEESATARLERLFDVSLDGWRERVTWRRRLIMDGRSGAIDFPGATWCDRPAIDRGDGVFLAGDMVAAPGLLSEVAYASGIEAARGALALAGVATGRRSVA
jgi:phytoene dehydrogenase-like protein